VASLMNRVYLDFNATTPVEPAVLDAMLPYFSGEFANAASIHTPGQKARAAVETAREQVAALIGARPQEIVFTSGGTESDNHAIFGIVEASGGREKHVITTAIEHEAVLNTCQALEKQGVRVTYLPTDREGLIDLDDLRRAVRPETILITIMHANNELGTAQPLEEIGRIAKEADVYFHTDAVQSAGKIPIVVNKLQVDLLVTSCTRPRASALYMCAAARACASFFMADITSAVSVPAQKTSPASWDLAKPPKSLASLWRKTHYASPLFATNCSKACSSAFLNLA